MAPDADSREILWCASVVARLAACRASRGSATICSRTAPITSCNCSPGISTTTTTSRPRRWTKRWCAPRCPAPRCTSTHRPGGHDLARRARGHARPGRHHHDVAFATYGNQAGEVPNGVALAFDDPQPRELDRDPADARSLPCTRVTFFISTYTTFDDDDRAQLRQLAADGRASSTTRPRTFDAVDYNAAHGIDGYLADEIMPALQAMRERHGYADRVRLSVRRPQRRHRRCTLAPLFHHLRAIATSCPQ